MRLTTRSRCGFQAVGLLVCNWRVAKNGYLPVGHLAARCGASAKYLEHILLPLAYAGILDSKRGQNGGYRLSRPPEEISLAEFILFLEGDPSLVPPWAADGNGEPTHLGRVLHQVRDVLQEALEATSIAALAEGEASSPERVREAAEALLAYI